MTLTPLRCAKCGAEGIGGFCGNCGAKLAVRRDLSVKHFLAEATVAVTDFDSALISSFRTLFHTPGVLTASYLSGERYRFLPPFRVFLLCNLLYFVAVAHFGFTVLSAPLRVQADEMTYHTITQAVLTKRLHFEKPAVTAAQKAHREAIQKSFETKYDGATEGIAKVIVVVLIPLYAILLQVLFVGARRFFAEHLIFSTHFVAYLLIAIPAVGLSISGYRIALYSVTHILPPDDEILYGTAIMIAVGAYVYAAQRVVYGSGRLATLARTAVVALTLVPMVVAFKFVLFFATLYWIS
ncbi:MAG: DUF3667 domain-containing protein [bacterium]